jgi:hypothetical protein
LSPESVTTASLLLVAYNHEAFIEAALLSALRQDMAGYELIIVDDASTDRTRPIIEEILAREDASGLKITTLFHDRNLGVLSAVNAAMTAASGEIFLLMAGDDVSMPDRLRRTVAIFDHNPEVQLVYGETEHIDEAGRILRRVPAEGSPRRFAYSFLRPTRIYGGAMPCGASAAYRRRLFDVFGPMCPGSHGEDNCFWVRALLLGEVYHDPACFIRWRKHAANLSHYRIGPGEEWRNRHLEWMSKHRTMSVQWLADVAKAKEQNLISAWLALRVRYAARKEDATWALEYASLRPDPWESWARAAWAMIRIGRITTTMRMLKLRLSRTQREKRWQVLTKLKSNGPV